MMIQYTLECGHTYEHRKHVQIKDGTLYCRRCKAYKKVTSVEEITRLSFTRLPSSTRLKLKVNIEARDKQH